MLYKSILFCTEGSGIDGMFPDTEEEFSQFREALKTKILQFEVSWHIIIDKWTVLQESGS